MSVICQNVSMYEIEIIINKKSFFKTVAADNQTEALDICNLMYPEADFIELV